MWFSLQYTPHPVLSIIFLIPLIIVLRTLPHEQFPPLGSSFPPFQFSELTGKIQVLIWSKLDLLMKAGWKSVDKAQGNSVCSLWTPGCAPFQTSLDAILCGTVIVVAYNNQCNHKSTIQARARRCWEGLKTCNTQDALTLMEREWCHPNCNMVLRLGHSEGPNLFKPVSSSEGQKYHPPYTGRM